MNFMHFIKSFVIFVGLCSKRWAAAAGIQRMEADTVCFQSFRINDSASLWSSVRQQRKMHEDAIIAFSMAFLR